MKETQEGSRFWQLTRWFTPNLPVHKSHTHNKRICVTYKLEKQLSRGFPCIETCLSFSQILAKSLGNYLLRRLTTVTWPVQFYLHSST